MKKLFIAVAALCISGCTANLEENNAAIQKPPVSQSQNPAPHVPKITLTKGDLKQEADIDALIRNSKYERDTREQVMKSKLNIQIIPLETVISPSQSKGYDGKLRKVLVLPILLTNKSQQTMESTIAHEWHGGLWPPTELHVSISGDKPTLDPVYLVGEKGSRDSLNVLPPNQPTQLNLRMDWPGTGSVRGQILMPSDKAATYKLRVVLFFKSKNQKQYIVSAPMQIKVAPNVSIAQ